MRHVMFQRTVWLTIRFSIKMMETRIHWDGIFKWWKNTNFKKILLSKTVIQKHSKNKDVFRKKKWDMREFITGICTVKHWEII